MGPESAHAASSELEDRERSGLRPLCRLPGLGRGARGSAGSCGPAGSAPPPEVEALRLLESMAPRSSDVETTPSTVPSSWVPWITTPRELPLRLSSLSASSAVEKSGTSTSGSEQRLPSVLQPPCTTSRTGRHPQTSLVATSGQRSPLVDDLVSLCWPLLALEVPFRTRTARWPTPSMFSLSKVAASSSLFPSAQWRRLA
mmetsp:Transcript_29920/g.85752  ORF Transcript_29920/g.85752 Transcript_29920/m.85752 type:complete len:200 (+) Transcript_29920:269-868(+)